MANAGTAVSTVARLPRPASAAHISPENWAIITAMIWPTANDPEVVALAWNYCVARKLDPLKRPVHIVGVWSTSLKRKAETIWPGVGELLTTAARSGAFAGIDTPRWGPMKKQTFAGSFEDERGVRNDRSVTIEYPEWCEIVVWRIVQGQRVAFSEPVFWLETYARAGFRSELPNDMWAKRPRGQLAKCAKAASLRAAFPEDIGGDYTSDEMEGAEVDTGPGLGKGVTIEGQATEIKTAPADPPPRTNGAANGKPAAETAQSSYGNPTYRIEYPGGKISKTDTGTNYLARWKTDLGIIADDPETLRTALEINERHLTEIARFDPAAAAEVRGMVDRALSEHMP